MLYSLNGGCVSQAKSHARGLRLTAPAHRTSIRPPGAGLSRGGAAGTGREPEALAKGASLCHAVWVSKMKAAKNYLEAAFWWALLLSAFFGWVIYAIVVSAH